MYKLPLLIAAFVAAKAATASVYALTNEHVDIDLGYAGNTNFGLKVVDEDAQVAYDPQSAVMLVSSLAKVQRSGSSSDGYSFVGVAPGEYYWRLPQSQNPNLLYLGSSAYSISSAIDVYDPTTESGGRVTGVGSWAKIALHHVSGPGAFSIYQGGFGGPKLFAASFDSIDSNDACWIVSGGHVHFNWAFSSVGCYDVQFKLAVHKPDGNNSTAGEELKSRAFTVHFGVERRPAPTFGKVTFQDFVGDLESVPVKVTWLSGNTTPDSKTVMTMDPKDTANPSTGEIAASTASRGTLDIVVKPSHWLSRRIANTTYGDSGWEGWNLSFINGDVDDDDAITIFDYVLLSNSFDRSTGESGFDPNADLDGDGSVTIFDYHILSENFDRVGEA
ncbi:MAG: choice-of-anchor M domain-containing protein [Armatimonadetes bacterium]|nr:choice-of-anchor M domain-containing protein [Armatimonadota bacterium]